MMDQFTVLEGIAAPMLRQNIDTDMIIRIERLRDLDGEALGPYFFENWRYKPGGEEDPGFVLNRPPYRDSKIMLGGENFACGSSREAAVWAMKAFGIRAVIAPSFGPIFYNNCFQNGLLPVILPMPVVEELAREVEESQGQGKIKVDLEKCVVVSPSGKETPFEVDALRRESLLQGADQIDMTRRRLPQVDAFEKKDAEKYPWIYMHAASA